MKGLFLDPHKPLSTCTSTDCVDCPLQSRLQCHFSSRELLRFFAMAFSPFVLGGIGIARVNAWMLLPWIGLAIGYFGFVEIRVMCSHCPHYAEPGTRSLQCWANYGSPKLWKYRPGPMTQVEKAIFFAGLVLIAGYPLAFLLVGGEMAAASAILHGWNRDGSFNGALNVLPLYELRLSVQWRPPRGAGGIFRTQPGHCSGMA